MQENGVVIIPPKTSGSPGFALAANGSRSPMGSCNDAAACASPIKLDTLAAAVKKQNKSPMKTRRQKNAKKAEEKAADLAQVATLPVVNDENIPSPKLNNENNIMPIEVNADPALVMKQPSPLADKAASSGAVHSSGIKASKQQPSVMRRLRSTFRMI